MGCTSYIRRPHSNCCAQRRNTIRKPRSPIARIDTGAHGGSCFESSANCGEAAGCGVFEPPVAGGKPLPPPVLGPTALLPDVAGTPPLPPVDDGGGLVFPPGRGGNEMLCP